MVEYSRHRNAPLKNALRDVPDANPAAIYLTILWRELRFSGARAAEMANEIAVLEYRERRKTVDSIFTS
jgi:hypothetical protein